LKHKIHPCFSVQYHPEASPGPEDANYLFDEFIQMMEEFKNVPDLDKIKKIMHFENLLFWQKSINCKKYIYYLCEFKMKSLVYSQIKRLL
jgi:hypothetical protein